MGDHDHDHQPAPGLIILLVLPILAPLVAGLVALMLDTGHVVATVVIAYVTGLILAPLLAWRANLRFRVERDRQNRPLARLRPRITPIRRTPRRSAGARTGR